MPPTSIIAAAASVVIQQGVAGFTLALFAKAFAVNIVLRAVGGALANKQAKSPQSASDSGARTQTLREPVAYRQVVVGTDRLGGRATFTYDDAPAECTGMVYTFSGHRIKAIRQMFFGDEWLPFTPGGWGVDGRYNGNVGYEAATGAETGQPFPNLRAHSAGKWTDDHLQAGCAKLYVRHRRARELFPSGLPNVTILADGTDRVWDPRIDAYVFTDNSALIAAWWLTTPAVNKDAVAWGSLNETQLIASANICDERVATNYTPTFTADPGTDVITFTVDEKQFHDGDALIYYTTGDECGISAGSIVWFFRTDSAAGQLATSRENAIARIAMDITDAGSGIQTLERVYPFTADASRNRLTFAVPERTLSRGDGVRVGSDGTLPGGLATLTTVYVIPLSDNQIQVAASVADAYAGTAIDLTDAGTGAHWLKAWDEARYTTNGSYTLDAVPMDVKALYEAPMAGHIVKIGALWEIIAGAYAAPTVTLTESDMDGGLDIQVMTGRQDRANGVRGLFVGRENFFQPTDFVPFEDATYLAEDNAQRTWKDLRFVLVRGHNRTRRLAKYELVRLREGFVVQAQGKLGTYRVKPGDIIGLTMAAYGWSNKPFEVISSKLVVRGSGNTQRLGCDMSLQAISAERFDWDATLNAAAQPRRNTALPDPFETARQNPPRVSGLRIQGNSALDTTFKGRDLPIEWRRSSLTGAYDIGSEPAIFGANAGGLDWWLAGYKVVISDADGNRVTNALPLVKDASLIYTGEQNRADQVALTGDPNALPLRAGQAIVWAVSKFGLYSSLPAILPWSNPLPTTSNVSAAATLDGLRLQYDRPVDDDWAGIEICASTSTGFTPDTTPGTGNLVYAGTDIPAVVRGQASNTEVFYRYRLRDLFGPGDWSAEAAITTLKSVDRNNSGTPSSSNYDLALVGASSVGHTVLAACEIDGYPQSPPAQLQALLTGQLTCGGSSEVAEFTWAALAVTAKPAHAGTVAIAFVSGTTYSLTGSGTDFTALAANDWIYLGAGKPLMRINTVTDATNATVRLVNGGPSGGSYSASGLAFTAFRGTALTLSPGNGRSLAASAVQELSITAGVKLTGTDFTSLFIAAQGGTTGGNAIIATRTLLEAQWVSGA